MSNTNFNMWYDMNCHILLIWDEILRGNVDSSTAAAERWSCSPSAAKSAAPQNHLQDKGGGAHTQTQGRESQARLHKTCVCASVQLAWSENKKGAAHGGSSSRRIKIDRCWSIAAASIEIGMHTAGCA